jgi:tetratricopeptide (TPR) repeat protein
VLYELLVGLTPFDTTSVYSAGYDAILKFVREQEAMRPSLRLLESAAHSTAVAAKHATEPDKLIRTLKGDLDWILLRALEKDRNRRYETANALAMDLRRYLDDEPVLASPPSAAYLAAKFVRRHRGGVAIGAATAAVLLAFALVTSVQNRVIARERDRAELESAKASAVNDFLQDMLVAVDPWASGEHDLTVAEAMDNARADVDSIFAAQPAVAAEMHATMGTTYLGLQKLKAAEEETRKGLDMRTALLGPDAPELADSWMALAKIHRLNMEPEEGLAAAREVVRIRALHAAPSDEEMLSAWDNLVELYITDRRFAEADSVLDLMDGAIAAADEDRRSFTAGVLMQRGRVSSEGRNDRATADSLFQASIDLLRAADPEAPVLSVYLNNAAVNRTAMEDYDRARETYAESLEILERRFGTDHPEYALVLENLGGIAFRLGEYDSCLANLERVKEIRARKLGDDHPTVLRTMLNMATVASMSGDPERAVALYDEIMPRMLEVNGEMHLDTATTSRNLGIALARLGRSAEARAAYARSSRIYAELLGTEHELWARVEHDQARLLVSEKRWAEAEPHALAAFEVFAATVGAEDPRYETAAATLVEIYEQLDRREDAARYRTER